MVDLMVCLWVHSGMRSDFKNLTGNKYPHLTVTKYHSSRRKPSGQRVHMWMCQCNCGNKFVARTDQITRGKTISCGCMGRIHRIESNTKHGKWRHPMYEKWEAMKSRCYCENHTSYPSYGGSGIVVDEPWKSSFEAFYNDMISTWKPGLSLERKNPFLNYNKENCCWIPWKEQWNNARRTVFADYNGRVQSVIAWSVEFGVPLRKAHRILSKFRVPRPAMA